MINYDCPSVVTRLYCVETTKHIFHCGNRTRGFSATVEFLPRDVMHSAAYAVVRCLPSVRLFIRALYRNEKTYSQLYSPPLGGE